MESWNWKLVFVFALQMTSITTKKKYMLDHSSSDESIENVLYYKDCKHKQKTTTPPPTKLRMEEPPKPACPCPRMCCSMCCECEGSQSFTGRQVQPLQMSMSSPMLSAAPQTPGMTPFLRADMGMLKPANANQIIQPVSQQQKKKRRKPIHMPPPVGSGRRSIGFTKEDIKSLISHDSDIKQILDDLVEVTMLKVNAKDIFKPTEAALSVEEYFE